MMEWSHAATTIIYIDYNQREGKVRKVIMIMRHPCGVEKVRKVSMLIKARIIVVVCIRMHMVFALSTV